MKLNTLYVLLDYGKLATISFCFEVIWLFELSRLIPKVAKLLRIWTKWFKKRIKEYVLLGNNQWHIFHILTSKDIDDVIHRFLRWIYII